MAIPKFLYTGSILNVPGKDILKKYSLLYNFIGNKRDRIQGTTQKGRIQDVDVGIIMKLKSIKEPWINHISRKKSSSLAIFVDSLCKEKHFDFEHFYKINVTKNDYQIIHKYLSFLTSARKLKQT